MANNNQRGDDNDRQERERIRKFLEDMDKARVAKELDEALDALNNRMDRHDADQVAHEQAIAHAIEGFADVIRFGMGRSQSDQEQN